MSEKRFLYRNFLEEEVEKRFTEEYDEKWGIYLSDNLTGDWYNINPVNIVDTCNRLWEQVVKLREENEKLNEEKEKWKTLCCEDVNKWSIFSREIDVLHETRDIDRFLEKYYKYCQKLEKEMNVLYSDKRRVIRRKLV